MTDKEWTAGSARTTVNEMAQRAAEAKEKVADMARDAIDTVDAGRDAAASRLDTVAAELREHAEALPGGKPVHEAARMTAEHLGNTAEYVRDTDMRSMLADFEGVVRRNPGASLLVAVGLGFVVGRAMRD